MTKQRQQSASPGKEHKKASNVFSEESAFFLLESTEPFPVNFDDAWQWIGYKRKDIAKDALTANFKKEVDYTIYFSGLNRKNPHRGRPKEIISLTIDAFKSFCMMAGTEKGKETRIYFLECEAELKRRLKEDEAKKHWKVIKACVLPEPRKWEQMFPKEFWDKIELVTGKPWQTCAWLIGLIYQHQYPDGVHKQIISQNPRNEKGHRRYKTHQFLTKDIGISALDMFKAQMVAIMDISPIGNYAQFRKNMNKVFGSTIQLELPLFDDELLLNEEKWSSHTSSTSNGSKSSLPTQKTDSLKQGVSQQKQNVVLPISGKC